MKIGSFRLSFLKMFVVDILGILYIKLKVARLLTVPQTSLDKIELLIGERPFRRSDGDKRFEVVHE